jgi:hypothetical protein
VRSGSGAAGSMPLADEPWSATSCTGRSAPGAPFGYRVVNVADQRHEPDSLYSWVAQAIRVRRESPEPGWGEWRILHVGDPRVLAIETRPAETRPQASLDTLAGRRGAPRPGRRTAEDCRPPRFTGYCRRHRPSFLIAVLGDGGR